VPSYLLVDGHLDVTMLAPTAGSVPTPAGDAQLDALRAAEFPTTEPDDCLRDFRGTRSVSASSAEVAAALGTGRLQAALEVGRVHPPSDQRVVWLSTPGFSAWQPGPAAVHHIVGWIVDENNVPFSYRVDSSSPYGYAMFSFSVLEIVPL